MGNPFAAGTAPVPTLEPLPKGPSVAPVGPTAPLVPAGAEPPPPKATVPGAPNGTGLLGEISGTTSEQLSATLALAGLLARMWLLRSADGRPGAIAFESLEEKAAPAAVARKPLPVDARVPVETDSTVRLFDRSAIYPWWNDVAAPSSGVASFLLEVADVNQGRSPQLVMSTPKASKREILRPVRCSHPSAAGSTSRDQCRWPRIVG